MNKNGIKITGIVRVEKYTVDHGPDKAKPYEVIECENLLLSSGITKVLECLSGASSQHFDSSTTVGIGNNKTTAPAPGQTDLQGASKTYKVVDAPYPYVSGNEIQFRSTFGSGDANYEWGEFVIKNGTNNVCLNRSTNGGSGWGTKTAGQVWVASAKITLS